MLDVVGLDVAAAKHAIKDASLSWNLSIVTGDYVRGGDASSLFRRSPPFAVLCLQEKDSSVDILDTNYAITPVGVETPTGMLRDACS